MGEQGAACDGDCDPIIEVDDDCKPLGCWPDRPLYAQLVGGQSRRVREADSSTRSTPRGARAHDAEGGPGLRRRHLRRRAAGPEEVCAGLRRASPRYAAMLARNEHGGHAARGDPARADGRPAAARARSSTSPLGGRAASRTDALSALTRSQHDGYPRRRGAPHTAAMSRMALPPTFSPAPHPRPRAQPRSAGDRQGSRHEMVVALDRAIHQAHARVSLRWLVRARRDSPPPGRRCSAPGAGEVAERHAAQAMRSG
jgi:hypothetical protein